MSQDEGKSFLECFLQCAARDLQRQGEETRWAETILACVARRGIQLALGPVALFLPVDQVVQWGVHTGFEAYKEWKGQKQAVGTAYDIRTTKSGVVVAENMNPGALGNFPIPLPEYAKFSLTNLVSPQASQLKSPWLPKPSALTRIDSAGVFRDLWKTNLGATCRKCGQTISTFGSLQLGHSPFCPLNSYRQREQKGVGRLVTVPSEQASTATKCMICGMPKIDGHAPSCILNPLKYGLSPITKRGSRTLFSMDTTSKTTKKGFPFATALAVSSTAKSSSSPLVKHKEKSRFAGVVVDERAANAIKCGKSLYARGILTVIGPFTQGTRIAIREENVEIIAWGSSCYSSDEIDKIKGRESTEFRRILGTSRGAVIVPHDTMKVY